MNANGRLLLFMTLFLYGLLSLIFAVGTPPLCTCLAPYKLSLSLQKNSLITKKKKKEKEFIFLGTWDFHDGWHLFIFFIIKVFLMKSLLVDLVMHG